MTNRVSLVESYNNKDVITQIFRLQDVIDRNTYKSLAVSRDGNFINFVFTTNDDVTHTFPIMDEGVVDVNATTSGSQVTVNFVMTDGTVKSFTYTASGGVTVDTAQTITGMKVFSAESTTFSHDIDVGGDASINGHLDADSLTVDTNATVDGDLSVGGALSVTGGVEQMEIGGMAIEKSGAKTVLSNDGGINVNGTTTFSSGFYLKAATPTQTFESTGTNSANIRFKGTDNAIIHSLQMTPTGVRTPTPTGTAFTEIVNKAYVSATDSNTNNLLHKIADEEIAGKKTFTGHVVTAHGGPCWQRIETTSSSNRWRKILSWNVYFSGTVRIVSTRFKVTEIEMRFNRNGNTMAWGVYHDTASGVNPTVYQDADGGFSLWVRVRASDTTEVAVAWPYIGSVTVQSESASAKPEGTIVAELTE